MPRNRCRDCAYCGGQPTLWAKGLTLAWPLTLTCVNHPEAPGEMVQVMPSDTCRNFRLRREEAARCVPPEHPEPHLRYIPLTKNKFAIVDAADYEWLSGFRWHATCARGRSYAATVQGGKSISMHRLIMNPPPGMVTDHINGNGLDNSRNNLRNCTPEQNRQNTRPRKKSSQYIGVYPRGDKWIVKITRKGEHYYLGPFDTEIEAAKARDQKALELFGPYAWLNFPAGEGR